MPGAPYYIVKCEAFVHHSKIGLPMTEMGQTAKIPRPKPHFCFTPHSDHRPVLFDHLVGERQQFVRDVEAERFRGLEVDNHSEVGRLLDRQVSGFRTFEYTIDVAAACRNMSASSGP